MNKKSRKIVLCGDHAERRVAFEEIYRGEEHDIVKVLTEDSSVGVHAEYDWIDFRYPEAERLGQALTEREIQGKTVTCDVIKIELEDGTEREIIFDISMFFGSKKRPKKEIYEGPEYCDIPAITEQIEKIQFEYSDDSIDSEYENRDFHEFKEIEKSRHNKYLDNIKKLALENPEFNDLQLLYAEGLCESIENHDENTNEFKEHLDTVKELMEQNNHQINFVNLYSLALYNFSIFYFDNLEQQDLKGKEEYIESIYTLWKNYPAATDALKYYALGLDRLRMEYSDKKDKRVYTDKLRKLKKENPRILSYIKN